MEVDRIPSGEVKMHDERHDRWALEFLTREEIEHLDGARDPGSPSVPQAAGPVALLEAWRRHVGRIVEEQGLSESDRSAWGAYDLIAALNLRSFLARRLPESPASTLNAFTRALEEVDRDFRENTERDLSGILCLLDDRNARDEQWWWDRVPRTGPIRHEIERIRSTLPLAP